ncbi:MAG: CHAD domain-containing protein [Vicinamibacterales bacterium]
MVKAKAVKGIRCGRPVIENARLIIETRLDEMLSFAPWVDKIANIEEIHNLRIAAKRLRYSLELFRFALPPTAGGLIGEVKEIQEHIGNMRDADVMIGRVTELMSFDARQRANRLLEIATAGESGTVAQRSQRLRSAMASKATSRDEISFLTLIAHRADNRDLAYQRFIAAWRRLLETDFPTRVMQCIGASSIPVTESIERAEEPATRSDQDLLGAAHD